MSNLISASEAARRLNVSQASISRWIRDGRVPGAIKVANMWLVPDNLTLDDINRPRMGRPRKKRVKQDE
ncbi:MAG TPA: DNA-binding protein [Chloroflexi bacterium]|nr:DNA-binding protein [Chloroflexota bacterium]